MSSLPTLPHRTWLDRASTMLAVGLTAVGLLTTAGWLLGRDELLQPIAELPAFKINASLGFAILGLVLLALELGHQSAARFAFVPAAIGLLTLAEYISGQNFGIDQLLAHDHVLVGTQFPGRMSPAVAVSLLAASIPLAWRSWPGAPRARLITEAVTGSTLAAAGSSTLLGYVASLPLVYTWGTATAVAPTAAVTLILTGLALVALAWRGTITREGDVPAWAPIPIVIGCLTLTMILWVGLRDREYAYLGRTTQNHVDTLAHTLKGEFDKRLSVLRLLARSRNDMPPAATASWIAASGSEMGDALSSGFVSLSFIEPGGHIRWIYPVPGNEGAIGANVAAAGRPRAEALEEARATGEPVMSATTKIFLPGDETFKPGAVIIAPVHSRGELLGFLAGEYIYRPWFESAVKALKLDALYHVELGIGGEPVYSSVPPDAEAAPKLRVQRTTAVARRRLDIALAPAPAALAAERRHLPEVALAAGCGITLLLGLSVHFARSARAGQRASDLSNRRLFAENEERRRIEARLKVSDERLRLALDSTHIGIFEWSVAAGHVYYSPGLWSMLGYDHRQMPSTVETWQSLIHPADLPLYRRRIESQLGGTATFIEPEYRVRAMGGEWRWVYTRSRPVASGPDGRPVRIIGTVQDITARREAEIALRESQAEARKLSLVAAKTDNPVIIASPDGRIEWANEAFCRMMEYSLEEVVGRDPRTLAPGQQPAPVVVDAGAALTQGDGISTDAVTYSKSGRKYHLHVEVQPVQDAGGRIVNFIAVGTDITARVETEQQLRRAKLEADEASRAKSEFLASMSHEIRTPMNGVIGMTSLLLETTLTAEQRDFVNTIRTSGEALLTIINDILDFSKIESGKMELERAPFELAPCLEEALDLFALQASAKQVELVYHVEPDVPSWLMGDVTRLRQVLVNLVNNAVKFTPAGSIAIEVRRRPTERRTPGNGLGETGPCLIEFTVRDTGIGIPGESADRLFKAFTQLDSSTTRKYGGTGLGLAICRRLCELMGGTIRVESRPGHGSSFAFTIQAELAPGASDFSELPAVPDALRVGTVLCIEDHPTTQARLRTLFGHWGAQCHIAPDAAAALRLAATLPQPPTLLVIDAVEGGEAAELDAVRAIPGPRVVLYPFGQTAPSGVENGQPVAAVSKPLRTMAFLQAVVGLFQTAAVTSERANPGERPVAEEIPLKVLLAEDNAVNQKVALRFLQRLGYRALAVGNGREAVAAVQHRQYDLVLMDLQMPDMDGYEATRQIRAKLPAATQPKIIALTANAMQGDREMCVAAGMDDHISKPVQLHELAAAIRRHFGPPSQAHPGDQLIG